MFIGRSAYATAHEIAADFHQDAQTVSRRALLDRLRTDYWSSIDPIADARFVGRESSSQATPVGPWWFLSASGTGTARTA
jgi:hypothetical protein